MPAGSGSVVKRIKTAVGCGDRSFGKSPLFLLGALLVALLIISSSGGMAAGQTSGSGTISGTVTNEAGTPLEGINVSAQQQNGSGYGSTASDGSYTLSGLESGNYKVEFYDSSHVYSPKYYDNRPDWNSADTIAVTAPGAVTDKDAVLSTCTFAKPVLNVSVDNVYWASYADYHDLRMLSIDYRITNSGANDAINTRIIGAWATNRVVLAGTQPITPANIVAGSFAQFTFQYTIPLGVGSFQASLTANAKDDCGTLYSYPP